MEPEKTDQTGTGQLTERKAEIIRRIEGIDNQLEALNEKQPLPVVCDQGKARPVKHSKPVELGTANLVEIKEPEWLVPGYIPRYGITTLGGEGGTGKTSIICNITAAITTGNYPFFMDGVDIPFKGEPGKVLFFSAEDSWEYVLARRLKNNGADMNKIKYLAPSDPNFVDLNLNAPMLEDFIKAERPELVIFDPIQSFIPPNLKMGDRNAMRKCFTPLLGYGEVYKTTFIIVVHVNKQSGVYGRKRIADSSDIWDSSRSVLLLGETQKNGIRYMSQEKSNYGKLGDTVLYSLKDGGIPVFKAYTNKKDRDFVLADAREKSNRPKLDDAKEFILDTLQEQKQIATKELDELAAACGISAHSMKDAKAALKKEGQIHIWAIGYKNERKTLVSLKAT